MKDYILSENKNFKKASQEIDMDKFMNEVLNSFIKARTLKHYVILVASDLDEYYTPDEHKAFINRGYYQMPVENRFDNRFFAPLANIDTMVKTLENEGMTVELVKKSQRIPTDVFVITLNGVNQSLFYEDFSQSQVQL